jgi:hypothetical protein
VIDGGGGDWAVQARKRRRMKYVAMAVPRIVVRCPTSGANKEIAFAI